MPREHGAGKKVGAPWNFELSGLSFRVGAFRVQGLEFRALGFRVTAVGRRV